MHHIKYKPANSTSTISKLKDDSLGTDYKISENKLKGKIEETFAPTIKKQMHILRRVTF
ncbi:hypothetical protein CPIN17260_0313 [Campylobacter pinnipediorum subsp. pinnipediorum]|nr:hypothetical protein CPIN17260_0313 [Campylobacter pinnipediorum subsp. pinnipediorum]